MHQHKNFTVNYSVAEYRMVQKYIVSSLHTSSIIKDRNQQEKCTPSDASGFSLDF